MVAGRSVWVVRCACVVLVLVKYRLMPWACLGVGVVMGRAVGVVVAPVTGDDSVGRGFAALGSPPVTSQGMCLSSELPCGECVQSVVLAVYCMELYYVSVSW